MLYMNIYSENAPSYRMTPIGVGVLVGYYMGGIPGIVTGAAGGIASIFMYPNILNNPVINDDDGILHVE